MALPIKNVTVGEVRVDPANLLSYRWNGVVWIQEGTVAGSSASLPVKGDFVGQTRADVKTGKEFKWTGSAWVKKETIEPGTTGGVKIVDVPTAGQVLMALTPETAEWDDPTG